MAPPKTGTLPKLLPEGFILSDTEKKKWRLGKIIGQGGFGLVYLGTHLSEALQYNRLAVSEMLCSLDVFKICPNVCLSST